jgi:hypothetical protein
MLYQYLPLLVLQKISSGNFFYPWIQIRDGKKSGSGMNIQDNFSKSLETVLGLKILKSLIQIRNLLDPGSQFKFGIRDKHPGSATLLFTAK